MKRVSLRKRLEYLVGAYGPVLAGPMMPFAMWNGPAAPGEKVAYLTFDDGPTAHSTPILIDMLDDFGAAATFFLLGRQVDLYPDLARELVRREHAVGVHGHAHLDAWRTAPRIIENDLETAVTCVESATGRKVRYYRPPFGRFTPTSLRRASRLGLTTVMWGILPGDYLDGIDPGEIASHVVRRLESGSIVVLHDSGNPSVRQNTPVAVRTILEHGRRCGWRFAALPDGIENGPAEN